MRKMLKDKVKSNKAMTMAEMLITVAIIIILAALGFIAIMSYQRSLAQLERDAIAKEIFIAAQNHLTVSKGENYPGFNMAALESEDPSPEDEAALESKLGTKDPDNEGVYYIVVDDGDVFDDSDKKGNYMLKQILPFGSIEDTVRKSGSYVIRYQPNIGKVMDVFYCSEHESPDRYNYTLKNDDYNKSQAYGLLNVNKKSDDAKEKRREYKGRGEEYDSVLGWYGGENLESLGRKIKDPKLKLNNGNTLYAESWYGSQKDYSDTDSDIVLRLIVEGKQSGALTYFDTDKHGDGYKAEDWKVGNTIFDDITTSAGPHDMHFASRFKIDDVDETKFIPGEDLKVRLVAFSRSKLANIAESDTKVVNSLFADISDEKNDKSVSGDSNEKMYNLDGKVVKIESDNDGIPDTAYIKNFRHLENLDKAVSNLDSDDTEDNLTIRSAVQTDDLDWGGYFNDKSIYYSSSENLYIPSSSTDEGTYKPVEPEFDSKAFTYNGKKHKVSDIKVSTKHDAGMFGSVSNCKLKNIQLVDPDITSTENDAGSLAGSLVSSDVTNVVSYSSTGSSDPNVVADLNAGGLVGSMAGGTVQYSAAAVKTRGTLTGGLVGTAITNASINGCFSGGHTKDGSYEKWTRDNGYDVTGTISGGLVGTFIGSAISNSYSTSSVYAILGGSSAGGFVGLSDGDIANCYSAGYVNSVDASGKTFLGSGNLRTSGSNYFYSMINEGMESGDANTTPFDANTESLKDFTSEKTDAKAYDSFIRQKYPDGYILKSVKGLSGAGITFPKGYSKWSDFFINTHYGDWPSPETVIVNL